MKRWVYGLVAASAALAQAQDGTIAGPALGFVLDSQTAAVRELSGIPGAATLGRPVTDASGLREVAVSSRGGYALGIDAGGTAVLVTADRRTPLGRAAKVALSANGAAAALYRAEAGQVDVMTGLPDAPSATRTIATDSAPSALAVSDDGAAVLLLGRALRGGATLAWAGANGATTIVHRARRIESIAFVDGGAAALVAEPQAVKLVGPTFGAQTIADGLDGVVAAAASADGSRIAIAMRSGAVVVQDRKSGAQASATCACAPAGLAALRGNAVFRLNDTGDGPLWLLDADSPQPRILFVAAPAGGAQ